MPEKSSPAEAEERAAADAVGGAETLPGSAPAPAPVAAAELLADIRKVVAEAHAAIPEGSVCGTPKFWELGKFFGTKITELEPKVRSLEAMVAAAGKEQPHERLRRADEKLDVYMSACRSEATICASPDTENACYEAGRDWFSALRAYAEALAGVLR